MSGIFDRSLKFLGAILALCIYRDCLTRGHTEESRIERVRSVKFAQGPRLRCVEGSTKPEVVLTSFWRATVQKHIENQRL